MPEISPLRPATPDEIAETLAFALRFDGRRRVHRADAMMAGSRHSDRRPRHHVISPRIGSKRSSHRMPIQSRQTLIEAKPPVATARLLNRASGIAVALDRIGAIIGDPARDKLLHFGRSLNPKASRMTS